MAMTRAKLLKLISEEFKSLRPFDSNNDVENWMASLRDRFDILTQENDDGNDGHHLAPAQFNMRLLTATEEKLPDALRPWFEIFCKNLPDPFAFNDVADAIAAQVKRVYENDWSLSFNSMTRQGRSLASLASELYRLGRHLKLDDAVVRGKLISILEDPDLAQLIVTEKNSLSYEQLASWLAEREALQNSLRPLGVHATVTSRDQQRQQFPQRVWRRRGPGPANPITGSGVCYSCRKPGHFARDCPDRPHATVSHLQSAPSVTLAAEAVSEIAHTSGNATTLVMVPVFVEGVDTHALLDTGSDRKSVV